MISNKTKKKYLAQINELERQKNLVISAGILSELNKVESLINNDDLRKKYESWQKRFNEIKNDDIPKITDLINEVQEYFETKILIFAKKLKWRKSMLLSLVLGVLAVILGLRSLSKTK